MEITFKPARAEEMDALLMLCRSAAMGCAQTTWDEEYPNREILQWDIDNGALFTVWLGEEQIGLLSMGQAEEELDSLTWRLPAKKPCEFARFGLKKEWQGKGAASRVLQAAFAHSAARGYDAVRILVSRSFEHGCRLYEKNGFVRCGEASLWDCDFYCYDRAL